LLDLAMIITRDHDRSGLVDKERLMGWQAGEGNGTGEEPGRGPDVPGGFGGFGSPAAHDPSCNAAPRDERLSGFVRGGKWDECLPGPELAAVLAEVAGAGWRCPGTEPGELIGVLRRAAALESWAVAVKLGVIRELIRQDDLPALGRPRHGDLPDVWSDSLNHELALALASSVPSAEKTALAAWELGARLPGIAALLADGILTFAKARLIAETFQLLSDADAARAEALILPQLAGTTGKTFGQIVNIANRIATEVDPGLAERRRKAAVRHTARVQMYREQTGAAALCGRDLPPDETLAAYANVSARAAEYKASGAFPGARIDQFRAAAYLDLIRGMTADTRIALGHLSSDLDERGKDGADDDDDAADDGGWDDGGWDDSGWDDGEPGGTEPQPPNGSGPDHGGPGHGGADDSRGNGCENRGGSGDGGPGGANRPGGSRCESGGGPGGGNPGGANGPDRSGGESRGGSGACHGGSGGDVRDASLIDGEGHDGEGRSEPGESGSSGVPPTRDAVDGSGARGRMPPALRGQDGGRPVLADLVIPLATLLGLAERPGEAHGLGVLDPGLCRDLAALAAASPHTRFCLTVTDPSGIAIGHGCARPGKLTGPPPGRLPAGAPPPPAALPARVNLTITADRLAAMLPRASGSPGTSDQSDQHGQSDRSTAWGLRRTGRAGPREAKNLPADPEWCGTWTLILPGGGQLAVCIEPVPTRQCDHRHESHGYQPNDTLRHLVQVRDHACTFPSCSRHARESDFEHRRPYDKGGRTCSCNAGAQSRKCHRVKQSPGWNVTQPKPGWHVWTTPSGRTYTQAPYRYPV
jgi:hypothetical protein